MSTQNQALLLRRLNNHCQQAMEAAASLCQTRGHAEITVDHLFIKLLELGDGDVAALLRRYEINSNGIWNPLLATMDKLPRNMRGNPSLSKLLVNLLSDAWLLASDEGVSEIRSAHLYMALLKSPYRLMSQDAWPLLSLTETQINRLEGWLDEVSIEGCRNTFVVSKNNSDNQSVVENKSTVMPVPGNNNDALVRFTINLTEKAKKGEIDPVFGRETEIRQMMDILSRRRKNNPILVGEPGVGKTALVEGLALKIASNEVPKILENTQVLVLDLGLLQAGAGVKGEFEQRLRNVIEAVQSSEEPILLFIDEAHTLIGAGNSAGGADAANLLKPALARGELRTVAATTWSEYKQYFEKDAALERRFQMVKVDEPEDEAAFTMLRGLKQRYAAYHRVHIQDAAVVAAVRLSRKYITGRQLPDKAVDLLDTAAARVRMSLDTVPHIFGLIDAQLSSLQRELEALQADQQLGRLNDTAQEQIETVEKEIALLTERRESLHQRYSAEKTLADDIQNLIETAKNVELYQQEREQAQHDLADKQSRLDEIAQDNPLIFTSVNETIIADIISDWTGVPAGSVLKDELDNLLKLESLLEERVVGQNEAIHDIAESLRAAKAGLKTNDAPLGVFLLTGPSGVGKTETALALADALFGGEKSLVTINLSEYREAHTVSQLKGSPPGYVGYGQGGVLTEAVRQKPYSVVLLDEVEKAHKDILNLFYQVFDKGMMRDGEGREIDFKNTVILMTSNLGADELAKLLQPEEPEKTEGHNNNQTDISNMVDCQVEIVANQSEAEQQINEVQSGENAKPEYTQAELEEAIRPILLHHFQAALLARMQIVLYRPLDRVALAKIVRLKLDKVATRLHGQHQTRLSYSDDLVELLADSCTVGDSGARNIDHLLNRQVMPAIAQSFLQWQQSVGHVPAQARLEIGEGGIDVLFN
ncbi:MULTISPECIES: type VI secretion system ATPase TssH [unclassified Neisseria]|uniref:type VI secretion system ATPase TssH n=1 Tax=unclassified Neisseria TaxID=2623750 RepID=UPI002664F9CA|nr:MULTISPECIES: type VI secretion system ATPase TssH [unclassified Neisseria]MDO1509046.1 type VI secretion system ATPase TssH [Neisseria sp. MVDL19-042950]MDO1515305.1 type VI secretion system ATPase TssH [Neisseria sp. MVDL18-041461]MDO1562665.1 type VI secretion system ATPase TssH [Neisseria sp. MVDL20-010259]